MVESNSPEVAGGWGAYMMKCFGCSDRSEIEWENWIINVR